MESNRQPLTPTLQRPPHGRPPIEHVVIMVQENQTYDRYFGRLGRGDGDPSLAHDTDPPGVAYPWVPTHGHWFSAQFPKWNDYRRQFDRNDIPLYYEWADKYALCDTSHSEILGPSTPNHMMLIAADSAGLINNPPKNSVLRALGRKVRNDPPTYPPYDLPTLPDRLDQYGLTWRNYGDGTFQYFNSVKDSPCNVSAADFAHDAATGHLPTVSWVHPEFSLTEHAPERVGDGMNWIADQVEAIKQGGLWDTTAVIIVWDDWGGNFDHVPAPMVEEWQRDPTQQFRLGKRVPFLILSPFAKPGYLSSSKGTTKSFTSILRFIEGMYGLPPINERDATADDLTDCFDFSQSPLAPPRTKLTTQEAEANAFAHPQRPSRSELAMRVFEDNVKMIAMATLWISSRPSLRLIRPVTSRVIHALGLDTPGMASHSMSGWPGTRLGAYCLGILAAPWTPLSYATSRFASFLLSKGVIITGDPAGVRRRKLHKQALQHLRQRGLVAASPDVHPATLESCHARAMRAIAATQVPTPSMGLVRQAIPRPPISERQRTAQPVLATPPPRHTKGRGLGD